MAITVVKYPQGYIVDTSAVQAGVSSSSGALFTRVGHGLNTGDFIYIISSLSAYNGYWYVNKVGADTFRIREYATASDVSYVNSGWVTYYKSQATHGWNSAHLPIIYKLKSDSWPINGVDTARTITTFSNWNGYTALVLAGDIKSSGTASALESVVLSGTSVDGVYKIVQWSSDTAIVIDLLYSAANVLSSGTCQYYYLNYHAKVKVYAGLTGSHYWNASKPYELITTQKLVPDSTGIMTLNVSEFALAKIEILKNDLQQDELPNDLDSWCRIYISVAEAYDDSNMYTVSEYVSSYTDDTTEVYAVNAKLPFQTRSAGTLDQYVSGGTALTYQKFLTPFTRPTLFVGHYFDVSYIVNTSFPNLYMKRDLYRKTNGNYSLISSNIDILPDMDQGVYRYRVTQSASLEDRIDLTLYNYYSSSTMSETKTIDVVTPCDQHDTVGMYFTWKNYLGGEDYWYFSAQKTYMVDVTENKTQTKNIYNEYPKSYSELAQSIDQQSVRKSKNVIKVNSQYLTKAQVDGIAWMVSSPLVQVLTDSTVGAITVQQLRTVLIDPSTLKKYQDRDNLYSISFTATYTDELPVQEL